MKTNAYFDLYTEIYNSDKKSSEVKDFLNKKFPNSFNFDFESLSNKEPFSVYDKISCRSKLVEIYSWAVTDQKAIEQIVKTTKDMGIIEIGAGRGYWASILADCGINIAAYDIGKNENAYFYYPVNLIGNYYPIDNAERKIASLHQDKALFLCWPPYDTPMAYNCVSEYSGNTLIYIGEDKYGCTADDKFFDFISDNFKLDNIIDMAQWEGIHDNLYIYKR
jgi:hypothetical protein